MIPAILTLLLALTAVVPQQQDGTAPVSDDHWVHLRPPINVEALPRNGLPTPWSIALSNRVPGRIFVAGPAGIYRSDSAGAGWYALPRPQPANVYQPQCICIDVLVLDAADRMYIGHNVLYRIASSDDYGQSWMAADVGSFSRNLVASPTKANVAYALLYSPGGARDVPQMGRSLDGGLTWTRFVYAPVYPPLAVDPLDATVIYGVRVSAEAAESRPSQIISMSFPVDAERLSEVDQYLLGEWPTEMLGLAVSRDGSRIWVTTVDGMLLVSRDRGVTLQQVAALPEGVKLRRIAADPFEPSALYGITDEAQVWVYREDPSDVNPTTE